MAHCSFGGLLLLLLSSDKLMWKCWIGIFSTPANILRVCECALCWRLSFAPSHGAGFDLPLKWKHFYIVVIFFFLRLAAMTTTTILSLRRIISHSCHVTSREHWPILCFLISSGPLLGSHSDSRTPARTFPFSRAPLGEGKSSAAVWKLNELWMKPPLSFIVAVGGKKEEFLIECVHTLLPYMSRWRAALYIWRNDQRVGLVSAPFLHPLLRVVIE